MMPFRSLLPLLLSAVAYSSTVGSSSSVWIPATTTTVTGLMEYAEKLAFLSSWEDAMLGNSLIDSRIYSKDHQSKRRWLEENVDNTSNSGDVLFLSLQFSLWHPSYQREYPNEEVLISELLGFVRSFLCNDYEDIRTNTTNLPKFSIVSASNTSESFCGTANVEELGEYSPLNRTIRSKEATETVVLTMGSVVVSDEFSNNATTTLRWKEIEVTYQVVEVGRPYWSVSQTVDLGYPESSTVLNPQLEASVQETMEQLMMDRKLDDLLDEYVDPDITRLAVSGQEIETFSPIVNSLLEEKDITTEAMILRQIGIAMMVLSFFTAVMLTVSARRHRLHQERLQRLEAEAIERRARKKYNSESGQQGENQDGENIEVRPSQSHDTEGNEAVLLETEDDVNDMLAIGRIESIKAMRGKSRFLRSSVAANGSFEVSEDL